MAKKEFDLQQQPYVDVTVRFYRAFNQDECRGITCFKLASVDVLDTTTKENLGSIAATTDGTMVLTDNVHLHRTEFMCEAEKVWTAFQEALAKKKCPECGMLFQHKLQCSRREDGGRANLPMENVK